MTPCTPKLSCSSLMVRLPFSQMILPMSQTWMFHHKLRPGLTLILQPSPTWYVGSMPPMFMTAVLSDVQIVKSLAAWVWFLRRSERWISSRSQFQGPKESPQMPVSKLFQAQMQPKEEDTAKPLGYVVTLSWIKKQSRKLARLEDPQLSSPLQQYSYPLGILLHLFLQTLKAEDPTLSQESFMTVSQETFIKVSLVSTMNSCQGRQPFWQRLQKAASVLEPVSTKTVMFCWLLPKQRSAQQTQLLLS